MKTAEISFENEIYFLIDFPSLYARGVGEMHDLKGNDHFMSFGVSGMKSFNSLEIENNYDDTFDILFYKESRYDRKLVDMQTNVYREALKNAVEIYLNITAV
jgi:hypothetical protein